MKGIIVSSGVTFVTTWVLVWLLNSGWSHIEFSPFSFGGFAATCATVGFAVASVSEYIQAQKKEKAGSKAQSETEKEHSFSLLYVAHVQHNPEYQTLSITHCRLVRRCFSLSP